MSMVRVITRLEWQYRQNNVAVGGGLLTITGKKQTYACQGAGTHQYTSAFLGSRNASTPLIPTHCLWTIWNARTRTT